jgi:hypothetical protein
MDINNKIIIIIIRIKNDLTIEKQRKWNVRTSDASNNRGNWNHTKMIHKISNNIPAKHDIKELPRTAILGTAHMLRKLLI